MVFPQWAVLGVSIQSQLTNPGVERKQQTRQPGQPRQSRRTRWSGRLDLEPIRWRQRMRLSVRFTNMQHAGVPSISFRGHSYKLGYSYFLAMQTVER